MGKIEKLTTFFAGEGIQFDFDNDLILSLGFGYGHYADNRFKEELRPKNLHVSRERRVETRTAEVAIIRKSDGEFITGKTKCVPKKYVEPGGYVAGWVPVSEIPNILACVAGKKKSEVKAL